MWLENVIRGTERPERFLRVLLLAVLLGTVGCGGMAATPPGPRGTYVGATKALTILQLNDVYEIFPVTVHEDGRNLHRGGMAQVSTLVDEYRQRGDVLLLHAGDMFSPSLLSGKLKHQGAQMVAALNMLAMDGATFGNHEFDFGCRVFADRVRESTFPWLAANVYIPPEAGLGPDRVRDYLIVNREGFRIGIFGVVVPIQAIGGCGPTPITFGDPIEAARKAVNALKQEGVDFIIGLTHLRMEQDQELARTVGDIDLIVGGHEHEVLESLVGKTLITKAGANALGLGVIGLRVVKGADGTVVEKRWNWVPVDADLVPADPDLAGALAPYEEETRPFEEVIGSTAVPLDAREETVRERESNLGNLVADIVRAAAGADVAILNGGSIRDDRIIPAGPLTLADIHMLLPFTNEIVTVKVKGATLREALENGVSLVGQKAGRFPQVSGMRFTFDSHRPPGQRVTEMQIGEAEFDPARSYTLAASDFLINRGEIDGYTMLRLPVQKSVGDLNDAIIRFVHADSPVCAEEEGRIREVGAGKGPGPGCSR